VLHTVWRTIIDRQPVPPYLLILATAALALIAVGVRRIWRLVRNAITIAHEGGHALVAVLVGRRLQGIRLQSDTSGLTVTKGKPTGLGMILTLVVGYMAPSLIGLGGAWLLSSGRIRLVLWIAIVLLIPVLFMIRNWYGLVAVLITGGVVFAISWYAPASAQAAFAYAGVWFLLVGGVRPIFELAGQRRRGKASASDVDQLATLTHVAGGVWLVLYGLICLGALAFGAVLLGVLRHPHIGG
jgi:Peptidase M50B-like